MWISSPFEKWAANQEYFRTSPQIETGWAQSFNLKLRFWKHQNHAKLSPQRESWYLIPSRFYGGLKMGWISCPTLYMLNGPARRTLHRATEKRAKEKINDKTPTCLVCSSRMACMIYLLRMVAYLRIFWNYRFLEWLYCPVSKIEIFKTWHFVLIRRRKHIMKPPLIARVFKSSMEGVPPDITDPNDGSDHSPHPRCESKHVATSSEVDIFVRDHILKLISRSGEHTARIVELLFFRDAIYYTFSTTHFFSSEMKAPRIEIPSSCLCVTPRVHKQCCFDRGSYSAPRVWSRNFKSSLLFKQTVIIEELKLRKPCRFYLLQPRVVLWGKARWNHVWLWVERPLTCSVQHIIIERRDEACGLSKLGALWTFDGVWFFFYLASPSSSSISLESECVHWNIGRAGVTTSGRIS